MNLQRVPSWFRERPLLWDAVVATIVTAVALVGHLTGSGSDQFDDPADPSWWGAAITIAATAPIVLRRRRPVHVLLAVTVAQIVAEFLDVSGSGFAGVLIATYSLGAHRSGPVRRRAATVAAVLIGGLLVSGWFDDEVPLVEAFSLAAFLVACFVLGDNLRQRRQAAAALVERAERAERERELLVLTRVGDERARIARELHDVVAHSVSVMVIQAAAARRTIAFDPARAATTLSGVEDLGRQAMNELRRVLGVLRGDIDDDLADGGLAPQPGLADLDSLVSSAALPIRLTLEGSVESVPAGVSLSAYRVVQEALTNVRRHAGPVRQVDVRVCSTDDLLTVEVADDGRGASADPVDEPGFGIIGMRERVVSAGGDLHAGPRRGGGWRVAATFPLRCS